MLYACLLVVVLRWGCGFTEGNSCFFFFIQVDFLRNLATSYDFDCFGLNSQSAEDVVCEIQKSWGEDGGKLIFVVPESNEGMGIELASHGWVVVDLGKSGILKLSCLSIYPSLVIPFLVSYIWKVHLLVC